MELDARFDRLEEALANLTNAQAQTETRWGDLERALARLAEAQARTEARMGRLEERMERVEIALARLAEAQARTETRVGRLEERMERVEIALARLAEAQARTETAVQQMAQQVGRLSDTIGFTLEDLAREVTPAYLAQHYGIHGLRLERRFFIVDGQELEVDFYGEGRRDGEGIAVVGEVRSRIYSGDVEGAVRQARQLAPQLRGTPVTVLFGFVIHPSAREAATRLGAIVISSSGR